MSDRSPTPTSREQIVRLARSALTLNETRYACRLTLAWLALYPGDLLVSLLHARALWQDRQTGQALARLEQLCRCDAEYADAHQFLAEARQELGRGSVADAAGIVFALGGRPLAGVRLPGWAPPLRRARQALAAGNVALAENRYRSVFDEPSPIPLAAITHLQIVRALPVAPATTTDRAKQLLDLAHHALEIWPECLQLQFARAESLIEIGCEDEAVECLRRAADSDVAGQAAWRWWGVQHPYRAWWPEHLDAGSQGPSALHDIAIPASVAAAFDWSLLPASANERSMAQTLSLSPPTTRSSVDQGARPHQATRPAEEKTVDGKPQATQVFRPATRPRIAKSLRPIQVELVKLAEQIHQPELAQVNGRFPTYVILTTRRGLETQYGLPATATIEMALKRLAGAVRARPDTDALLLLADDPQSTAGFGLQAVAHNDAWGIKRLLGDLDTTLAKHGERIGALLIVGGPQVVPFHHLPNPVDDADPDVPSDNPYACRDENYFTPEWPVGRLPGDAGDAPAPLLQTIENIIRQHRQAQGRPGISWGQKVARGLRRLFQQHTGEARASLGYTAAVWQRSSLAVYRTIGDPHALLVSPPLQAEQAPLDRPLHLAYFNLHGIPDSADWYGQRDPTEPGDHPHYPVALRPEDIQNGGRAPQIVFSEACYGAYIQKKTTEQALALKFLVSGSRAVIGSTCTSYGSVTMPLIAADLLGRSFWALLQAGLPAGEALRRAKINLVQEMNKRQNYLDGEDQKTLISFVLYGDPLAQADGLWPKNGNPLPAGVSALPHSIRLVSDSRTNTEPRPETREPGAIPSEVMRHVKQIVADYLPDMQNAQARLSRAPARFPQGAKASLPTPQVITLCKQVDQQIHHHWQYARLTLDERGDLVKCVISR
ncbi:MAG: C25 family cysteine peptidase [Chloroflexota bacterium]